MFRIEYFNIYTQFSITRKNKMRSNNNCGNSYSTQTARHTNEKVYILHSHVVFDVNGKTVHVYWILQFMLCFWMWVRKLHLSLIFRAHRIYFFWVVFCIVCLTIASIWSSLFSVVPGKLLISWFYFGVSLLFAIWDGPYYSLTLKSKKKNQQQHKHNRHHFILLSSQIMTLLLYVLFFFHSYFSLMICFHFVAFKWDEILTK